jgi:hypothetical protein
MDASNLALYHYIAVKSTKLLGQNSPKGAVLLRPYVKMCLTRGQRAWLSTDLIVESHQRLNAEVHNKQKAETRPQGSNPQGPFSLSIILGELDVYTLKKWSIANLARAEG